MTMPVANRALWAEKLSDEKLMGLLEKINEMEINGYTDCEELIGYADGYYRAPVRIQRLLDAVADARKEAALRWVQMKSK